MGTPEVGGCRSLAWRRSDELRGGDGHRIRIEHPSGTFDVSVELLGDGPATRLGRSALVRTARKLSDGLVWPRSGKATG